MNPQNIDPRIYDLYNEYCHGKMERRDFLLRASAITVATGSAVSMAMAMLPDYAAAQTISFTDERIKATYVEYDSPGGNAKKIRGYLVQPTTGKGPFPAVLVVHENRGLNPYIEDVARRVATEGFLAFAPDALSAVGGYPGNDDDGRKMQADLDRDKIFTDMKNAAEFLRKHPLSNGKLGVTGFCFGGWVSNQLAVELGSNLKVAVPFYGSSPKVEDVKKIKAAMLVHYAEDDERVNATREEYRKALTDNKVTFEMFTYPGTGHGFHNNSTPRYNEKEADIAWKRTIAAFGKHLN